jgi:hypothetical protein
MEVTAILIDMSHESLRGQLCLVMCHAVDDGSIANEAFEDTRPGLYKPVICNCSRSLRAELET